MVERFFHGENLFTFFLLRESGVGWVPGCSWVIVDVPTLRRLTVNPPRLYPGQSMINPRVSSRTSKFFGRPCKGRLRIAAEILPWSSLMNALFFMGSDNFVRWLGVSGLNFLMGQLMSWFPWFLHPNVWFRFKSYRKPPVIACWVTW